MQDTPGSDADDPLRADRHSARFQRHLRRPAHATAFSIYAFLILSQSLPRPTANDDGFFASRHFHHASHRAQCAAQRRRRDSRSAISCASAQINRVNKPIIIEHSMAAVGIHELKNFFHIDRGAAIGAATVQILRGCGKRYFANQGATAARIFKIA
jgi:hypothetical protein